MLVALAWLAFAVLVDSPRYEWRSAERPTRVSSRYVNHLTVHHIASAAASDLDAAVASKVAEWHAERGLDSGSPHERAGSYHYVILPDGTIQVGVPLMYAAEVREGERDAGTGISVALASEFQVSPRGGLRLSAATARQLTALEGLSIWAARTNGFGADDIRRHEEASDADYPNGFFDLDDLRERVAEALHRKMPGLAPPDSPLE